MMGAGGGRGVKKAHIVLVIALVAGGAILLWVHSIRRPYQVTFSDGYIISGDGAGPYFAIYEDRGGGSLLVRSETSRPDGLRSFSVKFENATWLNRGLFHMDPVLNSTDYYLSLMVGLHGHSWSEVMAMRMGERFEPELLIDLNGLLDYAYLGALYRHPSPSAYTPLPSKLLGEGHAYMVKEGEDRWVLDVDAWFLTFRGFQGRTYYVRLTFRMAIDFRPILI